MTMTAAELVASKKHILLDFDGPICAAFAGYGAANISRQLATLMAMEGLDLPASLAESPDPFRLLQYAAAHGNPDLLPEVDAEFRRLEVLAVQIAPPTPRAAETIHNLVRRGHTIAIVSNNAAQAVESYAMRHGLTKSLATISARTGSDPSLLKPNPHLVLQAMRDLRTSGADSIMVGDSESDVEAARSAHVSVIALVNKPGKAERLRAQGPDAVIDTMTALLD